MLRHRAYKYRIFPTKEQQQRIHRMFGCCRFVFNHFLGLWNDTYAATGKGMSYHACATGLPALKEQWEWLRDVDSIALQSAVRSLADSFGRFLNKQTQAPAVQKPQASAAKLHHPIHKRQHRRRGERAKAPQARSRQVRELQAT